MSGVAAGVATPTAKPAPAASLSLERFSGLLEALYGGGREASPWQGFLEQLRELTAGRVTVLGFCRPRPEHPGVTFFTGDTFEGMNVRRYAEEYSALDPFVNLPEGVPVTLQDMLPLEELRRTAFYRDFLQPNDAAQILGLDIHRKGRVALLLRVQRSERDPLFGAPEKALFRLLEPHLRQVLWSVERDRELHSEHSLFESITSRLEMGTVLLDRQGQLVYCNPVARHLLDRGDGLREVQGGLAASERSHNRSLQAVLEACCQGDHDNTTLAQAISLPRPGQAGGLHLLVRPLSPSPEGVLAPEFQGDEHAARAVVYIRIPDPLGAGHKDLLQQLFDLTPSEARLALALANGMNLDEIAEHLCVTRNTLRTQLRTAFHKTGVNQQSALVSLVLRSVTGLG